MDCVLSMFCWCFCPHHIELLKLVMSELEPWHFALERPNRTVKAVLVARFVANVIGFAASAIDLEDVI